VTIDIKVQARRIKERREALGLSQRAVEEQGAISQASLSRVEKGLRPATVPELLGIAHATGSSVGYLTGQSELLGRMQIAARAEDLADTTRVRDRLGYLMEMDALLDSVLEDSA